VTNSDEFTREEIESLLDALGTRLRASGVAATVYIVGGAAIALRDVLSGRRTGDVDAVLVPEAEILAAAREVASERGIRSTWLNSSVRPFVPPMPEEAKQPPGEPGLQRHTASDEHLLAMKIVARRGQRDMRDIIPLARRLGLSKAEDLSQLVCDVYGDDAIEYVHGGHQDLLLSCQAIERFLSVSIEEDSS
jgi:hypothetical protein